MPSFTFSDAEVKALQTAISNLNDMKIDMMFDDVESIRMHPHKDSEEVLTIEKASNLRKEMNIRFTELTNIHKAATVLGIKFQDSGYTR